MKNRLLDFKNSKFEVRDVMRYDDVGDYFENTIIAYDFQDDIISNAIFLHEFIEYTLLKSSGIDSALIDQFDINPQSRKEHPKEYLLYGKFHDMANSIERQFIENLGLSWEEHDKKINTKKIKIAVRQIQNELHKNHPDEEKIEESKKIVKEETK
jgi:hypothetical protein